MKKFIIQSVSLIIVVFTALAFSTGRLPNLSQTNQPKLTEVTIADTKLNVEIADSGEARKKGLGGRDSLATTSGMLFIFPKAGYPNFWMKDMRFALDLIWIKDKKVIDITKNVPPSLSGEKDTDLPIYTPSQPVDLVLEVNAGFVSTHNIKIGDTFTKVAP